MAVVADILVDVFKLRTNHVRGVASELSAVLCSLTGVIAKRAKVVASEIRTQEEVEDMLLAATPDSYEECHGGPSGKHVARRCVLVLPALLMKCGNKARSPFSM